MDFFESLIMAIFAKKAAKEIAKEFSDEAPVSTIGRRRKATYHSLRSTYHNIEDFPPSLLTELFTREPDLLDKASGEDVREILNVQTTHYQHKGKFHYGETWFTISAENRFICKELLSSIGDHSFRKHNLVDYSNRLFSPIANPIQHSITIGEYTLYYKHNFYYNLTLLLLIDADKEFRSGKKVSDKAVHYPKVLITDEIANRYGLSIDENAKVGLRIENGSYYVIDDFNSPLPYTRRSGWFEVRIINGFSRSDDSIPCSISGMKDAAKAVLSGNVWPSIIPGTVFDDGLYVPSVPFHFLEDADDLTIRGNELTCELFVCRLRDGWGGIRFKLRNRRDYYRLVAWLIPVLSSYCSIIRGWDYQSMVTEYWPTYPLNISDTVSASTTDKPEATAEPKL